MIGQSTIIILICCTVRNDLAIFALLYYLCLVAYILLAVRFCAPQKRVSRLRLMNITLLILVQAIILPIIVSRGVADLHPS